MRGVGSAAHGFRPAAISAAGLDARKKLEMEALEIEFLKSRNLNCLSSAAHNIKSDSRALATQEAMERISISAWWAFRRSIKAKLPSTQSQALASLHLPSSDYKVYIGFVEPVNSEGYAAVCILSNTHKCPYIVMGSAFDIAYLEAAEKAFFESILSWVGTQWLYAHNPKHAPRWDTGELNRRITDIKNALEQKTPKHNTVLSKLVLPHEIKLHTRTYKGNYISYTTTMQDADLHFKLANIVKKKDEKPIVFSQYNW